MKTPLARTFLAVGLALLSACELLPAGPDYPPATIGPGRVPPPPPQPPPPTPHILYTKLLTFGDSMTQGLDTPDFVRVFAYDPGTPKGFAFKLLALLSARYTDQQMLVANYGLASQTAAADANRLKDALQDTHPEVTLLFEGVNDLNFGASISDTVEALRKLVAVAKGAGSQVVVSTLPTQTRNLSTAAELPAFNAALTAMAVANGASVADVYPAITTADLADGLHVTQAGNDKLAQVYFAKLKELYEVPLVTAAGK